MNHFNAVLESLHICLISYTKDKEIPILNYFASHSYKIQLFYHIRLKRIEYEQHICNACRNFSVLNVKEVK